MSLHLTSRSAHTTSRSGRRAQPEAPPLAPDQPVSPHHFATRKEEVVDVQRWTSEVSQLSTVATVATLGTLGSDCLPTPAREAAKVGALAGYRQATTSAAQAIN